MYKLSGAFNLLRGASTRHHRCQSLLDLSHQLGIFWLIARLTVKLCPHDNVVSPKAVKLRCLPRICCKTACCAVGTFHPWVPRRHAAKQLCRPPRSGNHANSNDHIGAE